MSTGKAVTKPAQKYNTDAIESRRRKVWEMTIQGTPAGVLANILGVHRNTIVNDLKVLRDRLAEEFKNADSSSEAGQLLAELDWLKKKAFMEFSTSDSKTDKQSWMGTAMRCLQLKSDLLMKTGKIEVAAEKMEAELKLSGNLDITRMSYTEMRRRKEEILTRLQRSA